MSDNVISGPLQRLLAARLEAFQALFPGAPHFLLALSGGLDSVVLLHALQSLSSAGGFTLSAMHVNHGLSPHAYQWQTFCQHLCARYQIPFYSKRVQVSLDSGLGIEAAAREARYAALQFKRLQLTASALVTAHHVQDQSETLLLQLMRGAGIKGLSAMADWDASKSLLRPLLSVSRGDILAYAQQHQLEWVEDESNGDHRFDRNFLRGSILPALRQRYPQMDQTLARSAQHMAEAQGLLDVLAEQDLQQCDLRAEWMGQSLDIRQVQSLGMIRAKNMLRRWFSLRHLRMPNAEQLQDYWQQLTTVKPQRYLHLPLQQQALPERAFLHHYQARLYCVTQPPALPEQPL
ncbi:MAG TPA: tRNA lysidine(34) synthetase TilS, partial [Methylophilus sp.]